MFEQMRMWLARRLLSGVRGSPRRMRGAAFPGADLGRLTNTWQGDIGSINRWLRYELRTLRGRSRQLARGDSYGAKFVRACVDNIAGPSPFAMQAKGKFLNGKLDVTANKEIELAWNDWTRPGNCEVTGKFSLGALHRLKIRCLARDGEVLVRHLSGRPFYDARGKFQILDIDRLDERRNENLSGGRSVKMGVELSAEGKPLAYHLLKQHPGEMGEWNNGAVREHEIIPADQIEHLFISDWPEQVRGIPWMHAAMVRLWHLGGFEEAAVINARIGACKVATIETPDAQQLATLASGQDSAGNFLDDTAPGQYWTLPPGTTLGGFTPQFPDASVGPFVAACLRGAAAGVGMAYHAFANDPGAVNYSTARVALLDERDMWEAIQRWYIEVSCQPMGVNFLRGAALDGVLPEKYFAYRNSLHFQGKRWKWIDPEKEVSANSIELDKMLTSRTRLAMERGDDWEDILDERAAEEQLAASKGIDLNAQVGAAAQKPKPQPPEDEESKGAEVIEFPPPKEGLLRFSAERGVYYEPNESA